MWRRLPAWTRLALELLLALALFLLDARDLWFKLRWVGPRDAYAFSSAESLVQHPSALLPTANVSLVPGQAIRQASGWLSFLEKCDSLTPLHNTQTDSQHDLGHLNDRVDHVLGRNCRLGPASHPATVPELVFTSSLRADAVAWGACSLLFHHRKPPICHSSIVKQFRERYALQGTPQTLLLDQTRDQDVEQPGYERAEPGSDAEMEMIELLNVISKSTPLTAVVCVEGFSLQGPGRYLPEIFGCGSPSYYRSAFVGQFAASFRYLQRDKAWLTSDVLHVMEMALLVRTNAQSVFDVSTTAGPGSDRVIEHKMLVNVSCAGALYTLMVVIDLALMALNAFSASEIARRMLWPVWKSAMRNEFWAKSGAYTTKLGFTTDDYRGVLQASLLRSRPIALLATLSRLLTWVAVLPLAPAVFGGSTGDTFTRVNILLTIARLWVLVLLSVNAAWDSFVAFSEQQALRVARGTYVSKFEVACISLLTGYSVLSSAMPNLLQAKRRAEYQRPVDPLSFRGAALVANAFPERQGSLQNTPTEVLLAVFAPLVWAVALSGMAVAAVAAVRFSYLRLRRQDAAESHLNSLTTSISSALVSPDASDSPSKLSSLSGSPSKLSALLGAKDTTHTTAGILMNSSPTKVSSLGTGAAPPLLKRTSLTFESFDVNERLLLEVLTDVPIRARSLVRDSLFMEKNTGHQVTVRPALYLEHGVVLHGNALHTRCGFLDVIQTQLNAREHALKAADAVVCDSSAAEKPTHDVQLPLR